MLTSVWVHGNGVRDGGMAKDVHNLFLWATSITPRNLGVQGWKHSSHHAEELPFECHWPNYCDNPVSEKYLDPNATRT